MGSNATGNSRNAQPVGGGFSLEALGITAGGLRALHSIAPKTGPGKIPSRRRVKGQRFRDLLAATVPSRPAMLDRLYFFLFFCNASICKKNKKKSK